MADEDKSEEPTAKKLEDSRKKGQVARSRELSTVLVLIFSAVTLIILAGSIGKAIMQIMQRFFSLSHDETYDYHHMFQSITVVLSQE